MQHIMCIDNSIRSLGSVIPNSNWYQSMRGEITLRMDLVRGKPANTLVMMALAQGRGMFIIMEGGEARDVCLLNQIKEDFISCSWEMHGQPVMVIPGMGYQVCDKFALKFKFEIIVPPDPLQIWFWSQCWNCLGSLTSDKSGSSVKTRELSSHLDSATSRYNRVQVLEEGNLGSGNNSTESLEKSLKLLDYPTPNLKDNSL
jgi:hypothetical protein